MEVAPVLLTLESCHCVEAAPPFSTDKNGLPVLDLVVTITTVPWYGPLDISRTLVEFILQ